MTKRLIDHDEATGITTWFHDAPEIDGFHVEQTQDVGPILDANKATQSLGRSATKSVTENHDMEHVARIPMMVQYEWVTKYGVDVHNPDHIEGAKRLLNSNEYRYLRTSEIIL